MADRVVGFDGAEGELALAFNIKETVAGTPDYTEDDLGEIVAITANNEIGAGADGGAVAGKMIAVSPDGTVATVQVKGVLIDVPYATGTPVVLGQSVQFSAANEVDIAADLKVARGAVLSINTTAETCTVLL